MQKSILGFIGALALILSFQNCAAPFNANQELASIPKSTGAGTIDGGTLNSGSGFSDSPSGISITNHSLKADACSASDAVLTLKTIGAGNNPLVCLEAFIAGRDNSFRCTNDQFVSPVGSADWSYSTSADTWTYSTPLKNHASYVPGTYRLYVMSRGVTLSVSFIISNPQSTLNCRDSQVTPTPSATPPASNNGSASTTPGITWSGFTQVVKTVVGTNYAAYQVDMGTLANNSQRFGQLSSINGLVNPIQDRVISISQTPGDFSAGNCRSTYGAEISLNWTHESSPPRNRASHCKLPTSGIMYINVSHVNPATGQSSCAAGKTCSFKLSLSASQ